MIVGRPRVDPFYEAAVYEMVRQGLCDMDDLKVMLSDWSPGELYYAYRWKTAAELRQAFRASRQETV